MVDPLTREQLVAAAARLVTLPQAGPAAGKSRQYFGVLRLRYQDHPTCPFPAPVLADGRSETFDLQELIVWDERRRQRPRTRGEKEE